MKQLQVYLKDCYGIGELAQTFEFEPLKPHGQSIVIYAHNGVMKTSFAKTIDDIHRGKAPIDYVHKREPTFSVKSDGIDINPESIFVVASDGEYFESEKMMTLLSDKASQERYVEIIEEINTSLWALFEHVGAENKLGGTNKAEKAMTLFNNAFETTDENRMVHLASLANEVINSDESYLKIDYTALNDSKVVEFLDKPSTHLMLKDYVETYEGLIKDSKYFTAALYDYTNALDVHKSLKKNNFIKAKNKVVLVDKEGNETEVDSIDALAKLYQEDKDRVFENIELKTKYEKFDTEIGYNAQLRGFREWVKKNKEFIPILRNQKTLRKNTWYAYFSQAKEQYDDFVSTYNTHKTELSEIYKQSKELRSEWQSVVDRFNDNFDVPFKVGIVNKKDVVLNRSKPELQFIFEDDRGAVPKPIDIRILTQDKNRILSKGESRALFVLCVMFEIESRIKDGGEHLLVLDDISDSFDYKYKYAIIEYLHKISADYKNGVHMLVLTHNFDFYRAFRNRCRSYYSNSDKAFVATRLDRGIIAFREGGSIDEFNRLKDIATSNPNAFISLVPFARNLLEFSKGIENESYKLLTECLHEKETTADIKCREVCAAIKDAIPSIDLSKFETDDKFMDILNAQSQSINKSPDESLIEHKITLAISIRHIVESYIKSRFDKDGLVLKYISRQTGRWVGQFVKQYGETDSAMQVITKAMITTPESIHLNSFMYEPIMDMSITELQTLYSDATSL